MVFNWLKYHFEYPINFKDRYYRMLIIELIISLSTLCRT